MGILHIWVYKSLYLLEWNEFDNNINIINNNDISIYNINMV